MLVSFSGFAIPGLLRNIAVNYLANYLLDPDQRNQQDQVTSYHSSPPKWRWIVDSINFPRSTPAHVFAKLPFVTFAISSLMCLTTVICMKVRFETKQKPEVFSLSPLRFMTHCCSFTACSLFRQENFQENHWDQGL